MQTPKTYTAADILKLSKTIAVVGAKDKAGTDVDMVGKYMMAAGYKIIPVHPVRQGVWGLKTFKTLADIDEEVDIVNLFRAGEYCLEHAKEVLALPYAVRCFWMQLGIQNAEARSLLEEKNIAVIENKCIKVVHAANNFIRPVL